MCKQRKKHTRRTKLVFTVVKGGRGKQWIPEIVWFPTLTNAPSWLLAPPSSAADRLLKFGSSGPHGLIQAVNRNKGPEGLLPWRHIPADNLLDRPTRLEQAGEGRQTDQRPEQKS